ncbi:MAG TPA: hypothetical protein VHF92_11215 [Geodermatophilus sp.]|nr:hypothetical protein [Geodermatophilus sp.]
MTTSTVPTPEIHRHDHHGSSRWHAVRHYLEMVVAMLVGMAVLDPLWGLVWPGWSDRIEIHVLVMATNMVIGMGAWMKFRGHSWIGIAEMSAAMYVPFAVLFVPYWAGAISGQIVMTVGHVLMLPAMAAAMLWRPGEYGLGRK